MFVIYVAPIFPSARSQNESIELISENRDGQRFVITVKNAGVCQPEDPQYMQVFNIILRNCLRQLDLQEVKRKYCDPKQSVS